MQTDCTESDTRSGIPDFSQGNAPNNTSLNGDDPLSTGLERVRISDDARNKLKGWLNRRLKIIITDERLVEGTFICTDRDGNIILENSYEYTNYVDDKPDTRGLGLAMVPGKHIKSIWLSND